MQVVRRYFRQNRLRHNTTIMRNNESKLFSTENTNNQRYDVITFHHETHEILQIYSKGLTAIDAQKLYEINAYRLPQKIEMDVVPTGTFKVKDLYK